MTQRTPKQRWGEHIKNANRSTSKSYVGKGTAFKPLGAVWSSNARKAEKTIKKMSSVQKRSFGQFAAKKYYSQEELSASIPSITINQKLLNDPIVKKLKTALSALTTNIKNCEVIIQRLSTLKKSDDISKLVLENTSKPQPIPTSVLFETQLQKYTTLASQLDQLQKEQQSMLDEITTNNTHFGKIKIKTDNIQTRERQQMLTNLEAAYQYLTALVSNITNGTDFYEQCEGSLVQLARKCDEFCAGRMGEAQRIMGQLQQQQPQPGISSMA